MSSIFSKTYTFQFGFGHLGKTFPALFFDCFSYQNPHFCACSCLQIEGRQDRIYLQPMPQLDDFDPTI
jgi:hypothetical protein